MSITELMSRPVITCRPTDTLHTAAKMMWDHDCGAIPVTDDRGKMVGIVTDRDICMATYTKGIPPQLIFVSEAMAKQVFACRADDTLEVAKRLMGDKKIRRVPVIDRDNHPIGIISFSDIARRANGAPKKNNVEHEVVQTLAAICQPRPQAM